MKHFFCILLFSLLLVPSAFACGPFDRNYLAKDYYMFRLFGDNMEGNYPQSTLKAQYRENCEEWAKITSRTILLSDIEQVVYRWSSEKLDSLRTHGVYANNSFAQWLIDHHDNEVIDFLLLAKRSELIRSQQNSLWYYPMDGDKEITTLEEIAKISLAYTGKRLKDRYLLQAIRALFANQRYKDCITLWEKHENYFQTEIIKKLVVNYIYGAYEHIDKTKIPLLPKIQEMKEWQLLYDIQKKIHEIESLNWRWENKTFDNVYKEVMQIIRQNKFNNKAQWYYIQAFLADKLEKREEAMYSILKAKTYARDIETKDVIHVLELYLRTKYTNEYNSDFENYLYGELLWLDNKITNELTPEIKERIKENGAWNHICGYSQYYWNDMLRKIIIGNVVPLCIKSNYKTRALQYLNMADNGIFNKTQQVTVDYFDSNWILHNKTLSWDEYRNNSEYGNKYDYRNDYFINLDSLGVKYIKRLAYRIDNPISPLDSFLNKNSYIDQQYLYDIIGTQLIALRKYKEATSYLSHVSEEFQLSRNVVDYFNRDPFTLDKRLNQSDPSYKLHFAQKMSQLEYNMQNATDPNVRAESMLRYALGMQNSVGENCWVLTSYYRGCWESYPFHSQYLYKLVNEIVAESEKLKQIAFTLFADDERAAKAYQIWCMWKTTVTKYPNTETTKQIRGQCDNLTDYQLSPTISFRFRK